MPEFRGRLLRANFRVPNVSFIPRSWVSRDKHGPVLYSHLIIAKLEDIGLGMTWDEGFGFDRC
jgi:hypothetical protein